MLDTVDSRHIPTTTKLEESEQVDATFLRWPQPQPLGLQQKYRSGFRRECDLELVQDTIICCP